MAGILSTAGSLVLSGDMEGNFMAFDARNGQNLWHVQTGAAIVASPMTYSVKGKQYVAIASHGALFVFALSEVSSEPRRAVPSSLAAGLMPSLPGSGGG